MHVVDAVVASAAFPGALVGSKVTENLTICFFLLLVQNFIRHKREIFIHPRYDKCRRKVRVSGGLCIIIRLFCSVRGGKSHDLQG